MKMINDLIPFILKTKDDPRLESLKTVQGDFQAGIKIAQIVFQFQLKKHI